MCCVALKPYDLGPLRFTIEKSEWVRGGERSHLRKISLSKIERWSSFPSSALIDGILLMLFGI
jgi:hypothetical protein